MATTPVKPPLTILQQFGKVGALEGKDVTVTAAGGLEIKDHNKIKSFFSNLFTRKADKLDRIQRTAQALETAITADVRDRYSATGSKDGFDLQIALLNVNIAMANLKEQAQKLSSAQSSGTIAFGATGAAAPNADPQVAAVITGIDTVAGEALKQIKRLKPRPLSERTIGMFTRNPKDQQIRQLRKDLEKVNYDLTIIPSNHDDYPLVKREKAGLEYAIQQLEMHVPTYNQDMKNTMEDLGMGQVQIQRFRAADDFDPAGPTTAPAVGKDSMITELEGIHAGNPAQLEKVQDLKLMFEASLLVKAPIDYQARKATARIAAARRGVARGSIQRFGVDFERNVYGEYAKALIRGGLTYLAINGVQGPMSLLGTAGETAAEYAPEFLGPVAGMALATLTYAAPVIAAKPDLVGRLIPQRVKDYFRGGKIAWLLS